tara:strand:+ start:1144 stop:1809 length:666 start_codon:yes stop_codon:yes gene_type:complete
VSLLKRDIAKFLEVYHKFDNVTLDKHNCEALYGEISVVDEKKQHWKNYKVLITINTSYPHTIPSVYEMSDVIERDWDFHISKKGACCLDITHDLILKRNTGINLIEFYRDVIYPFFANHQYRISKGHYANGEYDHHEAGIIQYYRTKLGLKDPLYIINLINKAIKGDKFEANKDCPICGNPKYKKCCRPLVNKLRLYGKQQLESDLITFNKISESKIENVS